MVSPLSPQGNKEKREMKRNNLFGAICLRALGKFGSYRETKLTLGSCDKNLKAGVGLNPRARFVCVGGT